MSKTKRFLILIALLLLPWVVVRAEAADNSCLACHGEKSILSQGPHLYIDPANFSLTTHSHIGCVSCHGKVSPGHPADGVRPSRAMCKECHGPVFAEYNKSLHGNNAGCADCHNPHAAKSLLAVSGRDINVQCAKCHENSKTVLSHSKWLPQAPLHIDSVPCITCHTGSQNYVITMYLVKRQSMSDSSPDGVLLASFKDLQPFLEGGKKVERLIDGDGNGFISLSELKKFNKSIRYRRISLSGTMMPEVITHSYQIINNRWDCTFCHASGPKAQQTSYLAFPQPDGTYSRMAIEKGAILDILYGTPDFYMLGATRNKTLSIIGMLIAASGLMVPLVHGALRFITRKKRKELSDNPQEQVYLTPTPVRIWHWLNALGIVTLCITGMQIRFPEYANIFGTYKAAIELHNAAGVTVSLSFLLWIFYYLIGARKLVKLYVPKLDDIKRGLFRQAFYYFFAYFLGRQNPHTATLDNKFNAIQKLSYFFIMLILLPFVIVSGLLTMNIAPLREWIITFGGIKLLLDVHYLLGCSFFAFLCVHVYMATLGHTPFSHFRQMWTGWES